MDINHLRPVFAAWIARGEIQHNDLRFAVMFLEIAIGLNHDFKRREFDSGAVSQALVKGRDFNWSGQSRRRPRYSPFVAGRQALIETQVW